MESVPVELQSLVSSLQQKIEADHDQIKSATSETENLVSQLESKLQSMSEDHVKVLADKD